MSTIDPTLKSVLVSTIDLELIKNDAVKHPKITGAAYVGGDAEPTMIGPAEPLYSVRGSSMPGEIVDAIVERLDKSGYEIVKRS